MKKLISKAEIKSKFIKIKEILVAYMEITQYDEDSIEYLIDTIDYLIQDRIPLTKSILDVVIEDVMITSTFHRSNQLLDVISLLQQIGECLPCILSE